LCDALRLARSYIAGSWLAPVLGRGFLGSTPGSAPEAERNQVRSTCGW